MIVAFVQIIVDAIADLIDFIGETLPLSPFSKLSALSIDNEILAFLAWIIPFPQIIALLETWIVAVAAYYIVMVKLRRSKFLQ